jgi:threonine dehydrogenase-like Zn-dependent dehydrogenase
MGNGMKALVKTQKGKGFVEVLDVPLPTIGESDVLIAVKVCGVCGTDLHIYHDEFPYWPPVILGHEFSGEIAAVGGKVVGWKIGDRVVGEPHTLACGSCYLCRTGNPQICAQKRSPGWGIDGAFASLMRWPEPRLLHRVPESLDFDVAALAEPLANVVTDVVLTQSIIPGDVVAVTGPGPIGIMACLVAKHAGARHVVLIGTDVDESTRLSLCRRLPAIDSVINVQREDVVAHVTDLTGGRGVDTFIEASGSPSAFVTGARIIRKLGTVTAIGLTGKSGVDFPYDQFMMKSVRYLFNVSTKYEAWDRALHILAADPAPYQLLITHVADITQWATVFGDLEQKKGLKAIFAFSGA